MATHLTPSPPEGVPRRTALVTGSSSGVGVGIARQLAAQGFDVGLTRMPSEPAGFSDELAEELQKQYGVRAQVFVVDLAQPKTAPATLMQDFLQTFKRIDVLVNNAAFVAHSGTLIKDMGPDPVDIVDKIHSGFSVNFESPFILSWAAVRQMLSQDPPDTRAPDMRSTVPEAEFYTAQWGRGRIINITSVHDTTPLLLSTIYTCTKHALRGLTVQLAAELAAEGITANSVGPGMIATPMTNLLPEDVERKPVPQIPVGRAGRPSEVAGAVGFLASLAARYTTGQAIHCDGGFLLANPQSLGRLEPQ